MTEAEANEITSAALPCPFCGEHLVVQGDRHGFWVAHQDEMGPCIIAVIQLTDERDLQQWNTRPQLIPEILTAVADAYAGAARIVEGGLFIDAAAAPKEKLCASDALSKAAAALRQRNVLVATPNDEEAA